MEKTFSCSNTSKNAVRLYCYKEQFLSFCRVSPFGFPRCSDRDFSAESGAKITHFRIPSKSFRRFFRTNFFREPRCLSEYVSFSDCGCKDKAIRRNYERQAEICGGASVRLRRPPENDGGAESIRAAAKSARRSKPVGCLLYTSPSPRDS